MKIAVLRRLSVACLLGLLVPASRAQIIQLNATLTGGQEVPAVSSSASGSAVLIYDMAANNFDLIVTLSNFPNTVTATRVQEGTPGVIGVLLSNLGSESVYTRTGNSLTAVIRGNAYLGTKLTLLQNGVFVNIHSAAFPNGELRGQLISQPKRLIANMTVAQEQAAFPTVGLTGVANGFGAAVMTYNPGTNKINLHTSVYNYANTLTLSHYHESPVGVSGPVVTNLGPQTVSNYERSGNCITGTFLDLTYTGDPLKLLTGGAYLNFHSNIFPAGECRGQVTASDESLASRVANVAARGLVGTGDQVLIGGIIVTGPEPVRMLITAKGPSLAALGVVSALANPALTLYDSQGRVMAANDDIATASAEVAGTPGAPKNSLESGLIVVLPPGSYTAVVTGNGGTGVALLEATDLRNAISVAAGVAGVKAEYDADLRLAQANPRLIARPPSKTDLELCTGVAPTVAVATR